MLIRVFGGVYFFLGVLKLQNLLFAKDAMLDYLQSPNPIFYFLTNKPILLAAAVVELIVGLFLMFPRMSLRTSAKMLVWVSAVTIGYKIGLTLVHYKGPCGCLLGINSLLPISIAAQKIIADVILGCAILLGICAMVSVKSEPPPDAG